MSLKIFQEGLKKKRFLIVSPQLKPFAPLLRHRSPGGDGRIMIGRSR